MQHRNRLKRKKDRQKNGHKENRRRGDYLKKCLENSSAPTAWDATRLHIHYSASLESSHPAVAAMLSSVKLETSQVNDMVYALSVDCQDAREFAQNWVKKNKALVDSWFR